MHKVGIFKKILGLLMPYNLVTTPVILQSSETECGTAALAILLSYYKTNVPIEQLREMCGTSRDGSKATTLMRVAREFNFIAESYKVDINELYLIDQPVIAYWNFNHFIVINGIGTNKIFINDPASGPSAINMDVFDAAFTGVIIAISPTSKSFKIKSQPIVIPFLRECISSFYKEFLFIICCLFIMLLCSLVNSGLSKVFFDNCILLTNQHWMLGLGILGLTFSMLFCVISSQQRWLQFKLCTKASVIKSSELVSHMLRLPLCLYGLKQKSDFITTICQSDMLINLLYKNLTNFVINLIAIFVSLITMLKINVILCYSSLILSILSAYIFYLLSTLNVSIEKSNMYSVGKWRAYSMACIRNIETIKACGMNNKILQKWKSTYIQKEKMRDKTNTMTLMMDIFNHYFLSITIISIFMLGSIQVVHGSLSIGCLMAYYALHQFYSSHLTSLFQSLKDLQSVYVSHLRVKNILNYNQDNRFNQKNEIFYNKLDVPFILANNIQFYYNKTLLPTINNIKIEIERCQHIALVGATGSGKSTLAKILCGLFEVASGSVEICGENIKLFSSQDLANLFSYVSQEVSLFSGSIYENIILSREEVKPAILNAAIRVACLDDIINVRGLDANINENGSNLSSGEKQRIDIARAIIQDSHVLVLDEATSALDVQTEKRLISNLRKINKTIIFVAHRLSTIQHCDQIFVMHNGLIVEKGKHDDLMLNQSHYFNLIQQEPRVDVA
jgi:ATP-binding cassette subfamily C protein